MTLIDGTVPVGRISETVKRVELQPAYILHTRPYRNTSMLVDLLTPVYGRVSGVAKGVRGASKAAKQKRASFQPFTPLLVSWSGKSELKSIIHFETERTPLQLTGKKLFSALYINELLCRLLQQHEESQQLFVLYQLALQQLVAEETIDIVLRRFELALLACLGYGIELGIDSETGAAIVADRDYRYDADQGFRLFSAVAEPLAGEIFAGADLLALAQADYTPQVRQMAKRLCRLALGFHLGGKPLKSRDLFG